MHEVAALEPLFVLEIESGPDAPARFEFTRGHATVGRHPDNDLVLHDAWVSGTHGRFERTGDHIAYTDLGSRHGSAHVRRDLEARVHTPTPLQDGDALVIGRTRLRLHVVDAWPSIDDTTDLEPPARRPTVVSADYGTVDALHRLIAQADHRLSAVFTLGEALAPVRRHEDIVDVTARAIFETLEAADRVTVLWAVDGHLPRDDARTERRTRQDRLAGRTPADTDDELRLVARAFFSKTALLTVHDEDTMDGGPAASIVAPLFAGDTGVGALQVDAMHPTERLTEADLEFVSVLAHHVAAAGHRVDGAAALRRLFESFVDASVLAIEHRDPVTAGHSHRVTRYALELLDAVGRTKTGRWADASPTDTDRRALRYAAMLHDFGKLAVREHVLTKPRRLFGWRLDRIRERIERARAMFRATRFEALATGASPTDTLAQVHADLAAWDRTLDDGLKLLERINAAGRLTADDIAAMDAFLTDPRHPIALLDSADEQALRVLRGTLTPDEWEEMRAHVDHSQAFLERIEWEPSLRDVPMIAGAHHERLDGSGYPTGRSGDGLDVRARILMIADMYDAMTASDRPYRDAMPPARAVDVLRADAASGRLDGELVELFARHVAPIIGPGARSTTAEEDVVSRAAPDASGFDRVTTTARHRVLTNRAAVAPGGVDRAEDGADAGGSEPETE